jgi:hypothetical protein
MRQLWRRRQVGWQDTNRIPVSDAAVLDGKQTHLNKSGNGERGFLVSVAGKHRKNPVYTLHHIRCNFYEKKLPRSGVNIQKFSRLKLTTAPESVIIIDISRVEIKQAKSIYRKSYALRFIHR